jgi:hypothetical protein
MRSFRKEAASKEARDRRYLTQTDKTEISVQI